MGQLIYFIPVDVATQVTSEVLADVGLSDRFPVEDINKTRGKGPGDVDGWLIARGQASPLYKPDQQTWVGPFGKYHIGFNNDDRPAPADLQRGKLLTGQWVELLDGNKWLVPTARQAPCAMVFEGGGTKYEPLEVARKLLALAEEMAPICCGTEGDGTATNERLGRIAAECLSVNYFISDDPEQELSALRLLSTENLRDILYALIDMRSIQDAAEEAAKGSDAKKNGGSGD